MDQSLPKVVIEGLVINGEVTHGEVMEDLHRTLQAFSGQRVRVTIEQVEVGAVHQEGIPDATTIITYSPSNPIA